MPPPSHQTTGLACPEQNGPPPRRRAGFSLIEVTLAIAIVAFAFVALMGLLPAGLSVFNQTQDSTNEMRIATDLTSLLQATEFSELDDARITGNIYYFDVDGAMLDSELSPVPAYKDQRIYAAKIVMDRQNVVNPGSQYYDENKIARRAVVVMGRATPNLLLEMNGLSSADSVRSLGKRIRLSTIPLIITKTDGVSL